MPKTKPVVSGHESHSSILTRMLSQALILTAFIVVLLTTLSFVVAKSMLEGSIRSQLSSVASVSEDILEQTLQNDRERISLFAASADVRQLLTRYDGSVSAERLLVSLRRDAPELIAMGIYNADGRVLTKAGDVPDIPAEAKAVPFHRPVIGTEGWQFYDVFTPVWLQAGAPSGYIAFRYDARPRISAAVAASASIGTQTDAVFVRSDAGVIQIVHPAIGADVGYVTSLGSGGSLQRLRWVDVLQGKEDVIRATDEQGRDALVAYRYLPTLGWGLLFQSDRQTALGAVRSLAFTHASIGTLLLILAGILALLLARQLTEPLRLLTARVANLGPGDWKLRRSVHTGDEVEALDAVLTDMAKRLSTVYEHQEEEIAHRTAELRRQYALDRTILETIGYGVLTVDAKGFVTGANPAALRLLSMDVKNTTGSSVTDVVRICGHRGNPLTGKHPVLQCLSTRSTVRSPASAHFSVQRSDEGLLPVLYTVTPLMEGSKIFGAILVFQDITEERKIDYLKSEFISLASHQLRTPLSALRWYTELFAERKNNLDKEQRSYLKEMQLSVERMIRLLTSLLRASRSDTDDLHPEIKQVDVRTIARELHEDSEAASHEAGVGCTLHLPKTAVILKTDATLLRIVLQNLVGNAIKYSAHNAGKKVSVTLEQARSGIRFIVADQGMGIPKEEQKRVFQKFFRAKNVRMMDTDGNGLGLYITKTIVERLGGKIEFTSKEHEGTVFTVSFPNTKKAA